MRFFLLPRRVIFNEDNGVRGILLMPLSWFPPRRWPWLYGGFSSPTWRTHGGRGAGARPARVAAGGNAPVQRAAPPRRRRRKQRIPGVAIPGDVAKLDLFPKRDSRVPPEPVQAPPADDRYTLVPRLSSHLPCHALNRETTGTIGKIIDDGGDHLWCDGGGGSANLEGSFLGESFF